MNDILQADAPTAVDNLFERSILDMGIPPCPVILDRFMTEARKEDPHYNRLASIISSDVAVSASLIKTANSPFFGMRQRVRSVNEALTVLGLNIASRAVAGIVLRNTFPNLPNLERFWDASARVARISGWLAQHLSLKGLRADDAYTYALFRDCGIPVLLGRFPDYNNVLMKANSNEALSFTDVEEVDLPTNHAMVGCILSQSWWLPEEICLAIRNHHDLIALESADAKLPVLSRRLIAISQLAEHLIQKQLNLSNTQEWLKLGRVCLQILDISDEQLESLYAEVIEIVAAEE
jgi:HD-like signal output (HDOD) protein